MQIVQLNPIPAQSLTTTLNGQTCKIAVYAKSTGTYMDLTVNNVVIFTCVQIRVGVLMVRQPYLGVVGDFVMLDTLGDSEPDYTQFGSRYFLAYLTPQDVAAHAQ